MIYGADNYRDPRRVAHYVHRGTSSAFRALVAEWMQPPGRALDVMGAGGATARYLVQQGFRADVLDGSPAMIEGGRAANVDLGDAMGFICADITAWHAPPSYDYAVCRGYTLELLPRALLPQVLQMLHGALNDGGRLLASWQSPLVQRHRRRVLRETGRRLKTGRPPVLEGIVAAPHDLAHRIHYYLPHQVRQHLEAAGFTVRGRLSVHGLSKPRGSRRRAIGNQLWPISEAWWIADKR
jgi:SAM-dependent methyltransferase